MHAAICTGSAKKMRRLHEGLGTRQRQQRGEDQRSHFDSSMQEVTAITFRFVYLQQIKKKAKAEGKNLSR